MISKDVLHINQENKELSDFLESLMLTGEAVVRFKGELLEISLKRKTTPKGREFLMKRGVIDE